MKKAMAFLAAVMAVCVLLAGSKLSADTIVNDGLTSPPWAVGATVTNGTTYDAAVSGQPTPFNQFYGNINASDFSATWTFNYIPPATITGATISLGLIYSPASADTDPVASFTLDGTINLTSLLNTEMNSVQAPPFDDVYEVETITIPSADLADLGTSPVTFSLSLQGPGQGKFGTGPDMQAAIVNSTLDLKTTTTPPPPATPEPATFILFGGGLALVGFLTMRQHLRAK